MRETIQDILEGDLPGRRRYFIGTATAALVGGLAAAGGSVAGAVIRSHAQGSAADKETKATSEALAFEKAQAQNVYRNAEVNRRANYDLWRSSQGAHNAARRALGLAPRSEERRVGKECRL